MHESSLKKQFMIINTWKQLGRWAEYLSSPAETGFYVGWLGQQNLGDEILWEAAEECLSPLRLVWLREPQRNTLKWIASKKSHSIAILGGGTQIGEVSPVEWFKHGISVAGQGVVFGAGVSPSLDGEIPRWLEEWGAVLRTLPYVGVRGPESAATLARVGVNADILGDPVCWFAKPFAYWQPQPRVLGLNVGHSNGHMYGVESEIQTLLAEFASAMVQSGWKIEFFCVWPDDLNVTKAVAAKAGINDPTIHCVYQNASAYLELTRNLKLFVGIKLHGVALAMCANVPSLMLEYRPKCREFMSTLGMERFALRTDEISVNTILELVNELDLNGTEIATSISHAMTPIRARLCDVSNQIRSLAATKEPK